MASANMPPVALSPDGSLLAYIADRDGTRQLFIRDLDGFEAAPLSGTEGEWIAYHANGRLFRVFAHGGAAPLTICTCPRPRGASWGIDGTIVFATGLPSKLMRVDAASGTPVALETPGGPHQSWPEFLPDGEHLLYGLGPGDAEEATVINVLSLRSGETRAVYRSDIGVRSTRFVSGRNSQRGHLVYSQGNGLFAVAFDLDDLETKGAPVAVLDGVHRGAGNAFFATNQNGALVFRPGSDRSEVVWVDRAGLLTLLPIEKRQYDHPQLSPDGSRLVLHSNESGDAWMYDVERGGRTRVNTGAAFHTVWSPDGARVAYRGTDGIYWRPSDGSGNEELLWTGTGEGHPSPISWSRDDLIAFEGRTSAATDIWVLDVHDRQARPWIDTRFVETSPMFSPDGKWLAYVSDETGRSEVYVQAFPGPGPKIPISVGGGAEPMWSPDV